MIFPTNEPKIKRFADRMVDGLMWHQADFPHVNRMSLVTKRLGYIATKKVLTESESQKRIATKAKDKRLSELVKIMHNCLKKSEVDVAANPEKLKQIGWSPKDKPQPAQIPSQPLNLRVINKESGTIQLGWDRPADNTRIRNYLVERRREKTGTGYEEWEIACISYKTQITLRHQPMDIRLEYRVRASSSSGTGQAGNTVSVIL